MHLGRPARQRRRTRRHSMTAVTAVLVAATFAAPPEAASAAPVVEPSTMADAFVYSPMDGGRTVARWNGQAAGYTLPKAAQILPGSFDAGGGGLFFYNPGEGYDGVLRIRVVDGKLALSFRPFPVQGTYNPMVGDFDGNGITDILWQADGWHGPASYLWLFRPDGTYRSRPFDDGATPGLVRTGFPVDANVDGITDLFWVYEAQLWIMRADGTHTDRVLNPTDVPNYAGFAAGNLGPDDGVIRRRMVVHYRDGRERLYSFNSVGQSTMKELRPPTSCCGFPASHPGHFLEGTTQSMFLYGGQNPRGTEELQSITAGGNLAITPTPQLAQAYTPSVGDFDGNGFDDIWFWNRAGVAFQFRSDGTGFTKVDTPDIPSRTRSFALSLMPA